MHGSPQLIPRIEILVYLGKWQLTTLCLLQKVVQHIVWIGLNWEQRFLVEESIISETGFGVITVGLYRLFELLQRVVNNIAHPMSEFAELWFHDADSTHVETAQRGFRIESGSRHILFQQLDLVWLDDGNYGVFTCWVLHFMFNTDEMIVKKKYWEISEQI